MESATEASETPEAPKGKPIALYGAIVVGLAIGAGVGLYVVGPTFIKRASAQTPAAATAEHSAPKSGHDGKPEATEAKTLHVVDNLVLNPAGSGGTRFLMVNATFDVQDAATLEAMKSRDAEVRADFRQAAPAPAACAAPRSPRRP